MRENCIQYLKQILVWIIGFRLGNYRFSCILFFQAQIALLTLEYLSDHWLY